MQVEFPSPLLIILDTIGMVYFKVQDIVYGVTSPCSERPCRRNTYSLRVHLNMPTAAQ